MAKLLEVFQGIAAVEATTLWGGLNFLLVVALVSIQRRAVRKKGEIVHDAAVKGTAIRDHEDLQRALLAIVDWKLGVQFFFYLIGCAVAVWFALKVAGKDV